VLGAKVQTIVETAKYFDKKIRKTAYKPIIPGAGQAARPKDFNPDNPLQAAGAARGLTDN
jgi:hypothetical protein